MTDDRYEGVAQYLGLGKNDPNFHKAIELANHLKVCRYCQMVWDAANHITSSHLKEDLA